MRLKAVRLLDVAHLANTSSVPNPDLLDGETLLLAPPGDAPALTAAAARALDHAPLRDRLSENARRLAARFSCERIFGAFGDKFCTAILEDELALGVVRPMSVSNAARRLVKTSHRRSSSPNCIFWCFSVTDVGIRSSLRHVNRWRSSTATPPTPSLPAKRFRAEGAMRLGEGFLTHEQRRIQLAPRRSVQASVLSVTSIASCPWFARDKVGGREPGVEAGTARRRARSTTVGWSAWLWERKTW